MGKFKVGDIAIVKSNHAGHSFAIGEPVLVAELHEIGTVARAEKLDKSDFWFLSDDDLKRPTKKDLLKISEALIEGL